MQKQAIPHFWDMFDPSHWSIWWCEYKFNDDLEKLIMTQNVINGFAHQLHDMSEHLFGVLLVFGDEPHLEIAGCFLIRGHHVLERVPLACFFPPHSFATPNTLTVWSSIS